MFDLTNGTHYSSLHGHTAAIRCIQFHSEGSSTPRLVTGSEDKRYVIIVTGATFFSPFQSARL